MRNKFEHGQNSCKNFGRNAEKCQKGIRRWDAQRRITNLKYSIIIYYNVVEMFKAKVRKVGDSFGVLIPMEVITREEIKEGEEIELSVIKREKLDALLKKMFGSAKGAGPFERDREDRLDREEYQ